MNRALRVADRDGGTFVPVLRGGWPGGWSPGGEAPDRKLTPSTRVPIARRFLLDNLIRRHVRICWGKPTSMMLPVIFLAQPVSAQVVCAHARMTADGQVVGRDDHGKKWAFKLAGVVPPAGTALRSQEIRIANYIMGDDPISASVLPNGDAEVLVRPSSTDPGLHLRVLNYWLIREGMARLGSLAGVYPPEAEEMRSGQDLAHREKLGIWAVGK